MRVVKGEGMPIYRNPFEKGDMFITFEVTFPPQNFADHDQLKVCMDYSFKAIRHEILL